MIKFLRKPKLAKFPSEVRHLLVYKKPTMTQDREKLYHLLMRLLFEKKKKKIILIENNFLSEKKIKSEKNKTE